MAFPMRFEQSRFDKETPGVKEGSKKDMAIDRKQKKTFMKAKAMRSGRRGMR